MNPTQWSPCPRSPPPDSHVVLRLFESFHANFLTSVAGELMMNVHFLMFAMNEGSSAGIGMMNCFQFPWYVTVIEPSALFTIVESTGRICFKSTVYAVLSTFHAPYAAFGAALVSVFASTFFVEAQPVNANAAMIAARVANVFFIFLFLQEFLLVIACIILFPIDSLRNQAFYLN